MKNVKSTYTPKERPSLNEWYSYIYKSVCLSKGIHKNEENEEITVITIRSTRLGNGSR